MNEDAEVVAKAQATREVMQHSEELDPTEKLIQLVEEHTLQVLNGKLLPVPVACLRCEQQDLDQSMIKALVEGTVRACNKHLAQCAAEVRDFGSIHTLRRLGLDSLTNALHQVLARSLQPILETILQAKKVADETALLALAELKPLPSHTRRFLTSATLAEVDHAYDVVARQLTSNAGRQATRDRMARALSDFLGKNVSTGLLSNVRKKRNLLPVRNYFPICCVPRTLLILLYNIDN